MDESSSVIEPCDTHKYTVIFLHGLGDSGIGIRRWMVSTGFKPQANVRYIFPSATLMPVTVNRGAVMHSWFDVYSFDPEASQNEDDVAKAAALLDGYISAEVEKGIHSSNIIIGGISQGGAVALYWSLTRNVPVAGVVALSTWLPSKSFPNEYNGNAANHMLICHGTADRLVKLVWAQPGHDVVRNLFPKCVYRSYEGLGHDLCYEEMSDVQDFLRERLIDS